MIFFGSLTIPCGGSKWYHPRMGSPHRFLVFLTTWFPYFNLANMFWFSYWTLINSPLTMTNFLSQFFKVYCIVYSSKLHVYRWLLVSNMFSLVCSYSSLKLVSSSNVPNQVVALWATCFKNILICLRLFIGWLETKTCWDIEKTMGFQHEQIQLQVEHVVIILQLYLHVLWLLQLVPHVQYVQ